MTGATEHEECPRCRGTGDAWDEEQERGRMTCRRCGGSGTVLAVVIRHEEVAAR